ncbi:MAG TPA: hypothetical protein VMB47_07200 [Candidatus Aquilonibacter sp.]|nr:hypothetical protein [Candidatus Aquilonibacter sp.]
MSLHEVTHMHYMVVGILGRYGEAENAIQELEQAGIVGEQVEVITDVDEDARTENTPGERSTRTPESHPSKLARLFDALHKSRPDVRDEAGEMPNYIGEQEFYTSHVKQGGVVVVVRVPNENAANQAASILKAHGARTPGKKSAPVVRHID